LLSINNDKPGIDILDGKPLKIVADSIAIPIRHILNLSLEGSLCPQAWREVKVILLMPLALNKACLSIYAEDSTIYASSTTANEVSEASKLQSVLERVASNKLVLNISKTKSIVSCTNHSLSSLPPLYLVMNGC
jgi:hypothetical protein